VVRAARHTLGCCQRAEEIRGPAHAEARWSYSDEQIACALHRIESVCHCHGPEREPGEDVALKRRRAGQERGVRRLGKDDRWEEAPMIVVSDGAIGTREQAMRSPGLPMSLRNDLRGFESKCVDFQRNLVKVFEQWSIFPPTSNSQK